jgi:hypothetical protein
VRHKAHRDVRLRIKPLARAIGSRHPAIIRNIEPQEGCVTEINPHRSRGPWNAPRQIVAGRVEGRI